jgi:membrane protein YdbS with pleckstrin-like domain
MTPWRAVLAFAAGLLVVVATANLTVWHASVWVPIGCYAMLVLVLAVFEVGRYRPRVQASTTWRETGERFLDPSTGAEVVVYYDPATGRRDYRST